MRARSFAVLLLLPACATLATASSEGTDQPSAGVGPFRALTAAELSSDSVVPFVFSDSIAQYREPSVLAAMSGGDTAVEMYAVGTVGGQGAIVHTNAVDARSFYGDDADNEDTSHPRHVPPVALSAGAAWEGANLAGPSALRVGGEVWLYYAAAGGIGLAKSSDGATFVKTGAPVLTAAGAGAWESTPPSAPSVAVLPDGSFHMLYAAGAAIGEAVSADGVTWERVDGDPSTAELDPVLAPGPSGEFDAGQVGDPLLAPRVTVAGRLVVRVLYTGWDAPPGSSSRDSAIGFAARFGDAGALTRQPAPVYTVSLHEAAPALFEWPAGSMLYVQEDDKALSASKPFPSIAAAFAPVAATLPAVTGFPATVE